MPEEPAIADALDLLERAHQVARRAIANATTPQEALEWAAAFYQAADRIRRHAVEVRGQTAARIWHDEEFDIALADVGGAYGISEQRAHQIIKQATEGESTR